MLLRFAREGRSGDLVEVGRAGSGTSSFDLERKKMIVFSLKILRDLAQSRRRRRARKAQHSSTMSDGVILDAPHTLQPYPQHLKAQLMRNPPCPAHTPGKPTQGVVVLSGENRWRSSSLVKHY